VSQKLGRDRLHKRCAMTLPKTLQPPVGRYRRRRRQLSALIAMTALVILAFYYAVTG
jgi:hypothetical protein